MLRLIIGETGAGKTSKVLQELIAETNSGKNTMLVVPENVSFEMEKYFSINHLLNEQVKTHLFSFKQLAAEIFDHFGGLTHNTINEASKVILMRQAVNAVRDNLLAFRNQANYQSFISKMLSQVTQFKLAGLSAQQMDELLYQMSPSVLKDKLSDISLIYKTFQSFMEKTYRDPQDDLSLATKIAFSKEAFKERSIWIDGFQYFSAPEHEMICAMLEQAECVTITATSKSMYLDNNIFIEPQMNYLQIIQRAHEKEIPIAKPIVLNHLCPMKSDSLKKLQKAYTDESMTDHIEDDCIRILEACSTYDEIKFVAAEISELVRNHKCRYNDCLILCRDLERYRDARKIFEDYETPVFINESKCLDSSEISRLILSALEAIDSGYEAGVVVHLLSHRGLGFTEEEIGRLENYSFIWSVRGDKWKEPFENNPKGLSEEPSDKYKEDLQFIEDCRKRLIDPLKRLENIIKNGNGEQFAVAVFSYMEDCSIMTNIAAHLEDNAIELLDQEWNSIVDVLDVFSDTVLDTTPLTEMKELFRLALSQMSLGEVPNTMDHVIFAPVDTYREGMAKNIFILGVNEGVFPAIVGETGFFSTTEKKLLNSYGANLPVADMNTSLKEQFYLYNALSLATERVYFLYSNHNIQDGGELKIAIQLNDLVERLHLKIERIENLPSDFWIVNKQTARIEYTTANANIKTSIRKILEDCGEKSFCETMDHIHENHPMGGIDMKTAKALVGSKIRLSPTGIETFYSCPFMYYCEHVLKLKQRQKVEYSPFESGSAIHYVFEQLLNKYGNNMLNLISSEKLDEEIQQLLNEYISKRITNFKAVSSRFRYQFERLCLMLKVIIKHMAEEMAQSEFTTIATEARVGEHGLIASPTIQAADGTEIQLKGSIDRVDLFCKDADKYIRVIDYKSGTKDFNLEEVFYGINMQMLIYLYSACDDACWQNSKLNPAGVLYVPSKIDALEETDSQTDDMEQSINSKLKMKGLVVEDETVLRAMEKNLAGVYIPVSVKQDGTFSKSSKTHTPEEFELLKKTVYRNIQEMGTDLIEGKVEPRPFYHGNRNPCSYCKFGEICNNRNSKTQCRQMSKEKGDNEGELV